MFSTKELLLGVLLAVSVSTNVTAQEEKVSLQIKGSDTMVNLAQAWAEAFSKTNPNVSMAVTGGGSGTGIAALLNGTCDLAISSRQMKDKEVNLAASKGISPKEYIVALDGIAVVVNPKNPVKNLTMSQLRDIFIGTVKNWKSLGGEDMPIVILSREVNSGTHVFFKEHVLRRMQEGAKDEFAPEALLMSSSQAIADEVSQNQNAVGYYGMGYISPKEKVIAIAKEEGSVYFEPTIENVTTNKYPISRPLFIYSKGDPQGAVKAFVDFLFSPEGQTIVKNTDFVPIK